MHSPQEIVQEFPKPLSESHVDRHPQRLPPLIMQLAMYSEGPVDAGQRLDDAPTGTRQWRTSLAFPISLHDWSCPEKSLPWWDVSINRAMNTLEQEKNKPEKPAGRFHYLAIPQKNIFAQPENPVWRSSLILTHVPKHLLKVKAFEARLRGPTFFLTFFQSCPFQTRATGARLSLLLWKVHLKEYEHTWLSPLHLNHCMQLCFLWDWHTLTYKVTLCDHLRDSDANNNKVFLCDKSDENLVT